MADKVVFDEIDAGFLRDESRQSGTALALARPRTEDELRDALRLAGERGWPVAVQGGRTGLTGGAVPNGGLIVNLSRMNHITGLRQTHDGRFFLTVQPGVVLQDLRRAIVTCDFDTTGWCQESLTVLTALRAAPKQWFSPDPTETTATLGGMASCNSSGACSFRYGAMRNYVSGVRLMLVDGDVLTLRRGAIRTQGRRFELMTENQCRLSGCLPGYTMPKTKNAAGYFSADAMDPVDLFIGSEGTLGIFTELELQLLPKPAVCWGIMAFFPNQQLAVDFVIAARASGDLQLAALEFFDERSLNVLRRERPNLTAIASLPELPSGFHTAVYAEIHAQDEDSAMETAGRLTVCGADEESVWMAATEHDMEKFKAFRHALPEAVNRLIDERRKTEPLLTKLGTDMAVPDAHLAEIMEHYTADLQRAGLDYVIFGHIGNNHLHVNILPFTLEDYRTGRELYLSWAQEVVSLGGTVSAEHGIGKIKAPMLKMLFGERGIQEMQVFKRVFDPKFRLSPGTLFPALP